MKGSLRNALAFTEGGVRKLIRGTAVVVGSTVGISMQASALTLTDVMASLDTVETDITTVGIAIIGLAAVAMSIRWVKAQFF